VGVRTGLRYFLFFVVFPSAGSGRRSARRRRSAAAARGRKGRRIGRARIADAAPDRRGIGVALTGRVP
jgi:hypothetical protein